MKKSFVALLAVLLMAGCASVEPKDETRGDRKSTRLNSSH